MCFGRHGETHRIDAPDELAPIFGPLHLSFVSDGACGLFVEIADGDELRRAFACERGVNARVLATKTANADDCCTERHGFCNLAADQTTGAEYTCILLRLPSDSTFSCLPSLSLSIYTDSAGCRCSVRTSRATRKLRAKCSCAAI